MNKILITGTSGFIGGHLLRFFSNEKYHVIGWGKENNELNKDINMENYDEVKDSLAIDNPNYIIHCAGSANVRNSFLDVKKDFNSNVLCTYNLLQAVKENNIHAKIIYLSSAAVYGNPKTLPISEQAERNPLSPYALHKTMCEDICFYFIKNYKFDIKIVRPFSVYGRKLKKQIFWDMNNKLSETNEMVMFGTGEETRDFIYIDDLVQAIALILKTNDENIIYNIANGQQEKIKTVAYSFAKAKNIDLSKVSFNGIRREGEPINWEADISKLKAIGYQRKISFTEGVIDYVNWLNDQER